MKYFIVTGGAGFIGSNLIELLLKKTKENILSLDDYSTGNKKNHLKNKRVKYIKGNTKYFKKFFYKYKNNTKAIFHFAEFSRIAQSFIKTDKCFESNLKGTYEVIDFCLKNKIKIIYSATSASLGNNGLDQNLSPYAYTKSKNMNLIMNLNQWFNLKYEIIYFYNVYGPRQIYNNFMSAVIAIFEDCTKKNKKLPIVKPGTQRRNFTHVTDTVEACLYAFKKNKNRHYSVFSKYSYSIIEIAKLFSKKYKFVSSRRGERFKSAQVKKILNKKIYNISAKRKITSYIKTFKNNINKGM